MNLNWILSPVTIYAVIATALIAALVLFITAKLEIQQALSAARDARQSVDGAVEKLSVGIEQLRTEMSLPAPASAPAPGPALNLTKRTQALRMLRRGESVGSIASALRAPRNEIELLVKVQRMVQGPPLA
jgi:DNA-binding NarL/FixJ family response regulator